MAQIILTFEWDGETVKKETKGFIGSTCVGKTKFIEEELGIAGERTQTSEYYAKETTKQAAQLGAGTNL